MTNSIALRYKNVYKPDIGAIALLGCIHVQNGLGFPKEYDTWSEIAQRNYENGRLTAAAFELVYKAESPKFNTINSDTYSKFCEYRSHVTRAIGKFIPDINKTSTVQLSSTASNFPDLSEYIKASRTEIRQSQKVSAEDCLV